MDSTSIVLLAYLAIGFLSITTFCYLRRNEGGLRKLKFLAYFSLGDLGLFFFAAFLWPLFFLFVFLHRWSHKIAINSGEPPNEPRA